jgi:hypothetical protein
MGSAVTGVGGEWTPCVVVAASTGGPAALLALVGGLPPTFPASLLLVQHLPAPHTARLGGRPGHVAAGGSLCLVVATPCGELALLVDEVHGFTRASAEGPEMPMTRLEPGDPRSWHAVDPRR